VEGEPVAIEVGAIDVAEAGFGAITLTEDGVRRAYRLHTVGAVTYVDGPDGSSALTEEERFPLAGTKLAAGACIAPLPGSVVRVPVSVGDAVTAGAVLVAIEAMKMEHEVRAPSEGTVTEVHVSPGEQVEAGRLLVVIEPADGDPDEGP
jgi:propionyl-CoA carboxylase alpha chain